MAKIARSFRIVDYGIDNSQFFQGHGTSGTKWEAAATGAGDTFRESVDDALESLAQDDWDLSEIEDEIEEQIAEAEKEAGGEGVSANEYQLKSLMENLTDEDVRREAELDEDEQVTDDHRRQVAEEMLSDDGGDIYYYTAVDVSEAEGVD